MRYWDHILIENLKPAQKRRAAQLIKALEELPRVHRSLTDRGVKYAECVHLQLSAAEMVGGLCQGAENYFTLPSQIGKEVLEATRQIILEHIRELGEKA